MVTQIQLGNIFTANDRTVFGGTASGLDTEGIISSLTEAKRLPAVALEEEIEENTEKIAAFQELSGIITRFKDAANFLRNPPGVGNEDENVFKFRTTSLTSSDGSTASNFLDVSPQSGAEIGSHEITVDQVATRTIQISSDILIADADTTPVVTAAPTAGRFTAGILDLDGTNTITLNDGDTLEDVVAKINSVQNDSGIRAELIAKNVGSTYAIVLSSTSTGSATDFDMMDPALGNDVGVFANLGFNPQTTGLDAQMTVDGVAITRSSNTINDVFDDVTFTLKEETAPGVTLTSEIEPDLELVQQGILNFIDAYNEMRIFMSKQTETRDDGTLAESALLASNSTLRAINSRVTSEMGGLVDGLTSGDPDKLADIGITFDDFEGDEETPFTRNILRVDTDELNNALQNDFDAVRRVFEFDITSDSNDLAVFERSNALGVSEFTMNIDLTNNIYTVDYIDEAMNPQTIELDYQILDSGGVTLSGQDGTVLDGLVMVYTGGDGTVNVNVSQGIGDRVYNSVKDLQDTQNGALSIEIESLEDENTRAQEEITRIDELVEDYRDQLLTRFGQLEATIASVNTLLQSLDAQAQARNSA